MMKTVSGVIASPPGHWVGDGFPVRSLFSYNRLGEQLSPFLLLDYAGPAHFTPTARPRGVGEHPHRGFETVTIVYQGEVAHRDSVGNGGIISVGDVQWMTAAGGILHEEFHSPEFTARGGVLQMAQLWVNLPADRKMSAPRYQALPSASIPVLRLSQVGSVGGGSMDAGSVRIVAGTYEGLRGPAATCSPLNVWDVQMRAGGAAALAVPEGHMAALAILRGRIGVNGASPVGAVQTMLLGTAGDEIRLEAVEPTSVLVLSGEPLGEPIVGHGPFVMNSKDEIHQAIRDFQDGKFGSMPHGESRRLRPGNASTP